MKNMKKSRKIGWASIIVAVLIGSIILLLNNILLLSPSGVIYDRSPTLRWSGFSDGYQVLVSEDPDFNNPIIEKEVDGTDFAIENDLEFGEYYWKVVSKDGESITGYFVIDSMVQVENNEKVRNKGNTPILISGITGGAVLDIEEEVELEGGNYTVEQI